MADHICIKQSLIRPYRRERRRFARDKNWEWHLNRSVDIYGHKRGHPRQSEWSNYARPLLDEGTTYHSQIVNIYCDRDLEFIHRHTYTYIYIWIYIYLYIYVNKLYMYCNYTYFNLNYYLMKSILRYCKYINFDIF